MKHSIIVGYGLAGLSYATQLKLQNHDFVIIDQPTTNATRKAAGVMNPTVLKRYTLAWNADEFIPYAQSFYHCVKELLKRPFLNLLPIHRHFIDASEQNNWITASNSILLQPYLNNTISDQLLSVYKGHYGYGEVQQTGRLKTQDTLEHFKSALESDQFWVSRFDYDALEIYDNHVVYNNIKAENIVFCEGYGLKKNPFFNHLPLVGSKGELLRIKAPTLPRNRMIKAHGIFIVPVENDSFWVGATFNRNDKSFAPTEDAKEWLLRKLNQVIGAPFEIISHEVCIRPTVADRRPLLGQHPKYSKLFLFNGLGTRGVLMAPLLSHWLFDLITKKKSLPETVDLQRFSLSKPSKTISS